MQSLAVYDEHKFAIDTGHFSDTEMDFYWTSTTSVGDHGNAGNVNLGTGYVGYQYGDKSLTHYLRCVRGGQKEIDGDLLIVTPDQASTWRSGGTIPIRWDPQGIAGSVEISISRDAGKTYQTVAENTENDGSHEWTVTGPASVNCMLKIEPVGDPSKGTIQGLFAIQHDMGNGLVAYYPFNGNANDQSGNGNHGAINGATSTQDRSGTDAGAYSFDGNDDIIVPSSDALNFGTGDFTLALWLRPTDQSGNDHIIGKDTSDGTSTYSGYYFEHLANGQIRFATRNLISGTGPENWLDSVSLVTIGEWVHITGKREDNVLRLYVNGVYDSSHSESQPTDVSTDTAFKIGRFDDISFSARFAGDIDDVVVYDRALSGAEIQALHSSGIDTDSDGMIDSWETRHFGDLAQDSGADADGDKFTNRREYQDQTDPADGASYLIFPAATGRIPDTGQSKCYGNSGEIACPQEGEAFYGQDAS